MKFCVLSSGSKANSTYIEVAGSRILIDCGLSAKQAEERMRLHGLDPSRLDAILITHEHSDHIHGVPALSKRYKIPVFANQNTSDQFAKCFHKEIFRSGEDIWVGAARIEPFSIVHDAVDPVGYVIHGEGLKFSQATDLGRVTTLVREKLSGSNALVLESNHDQEMLRSCDYPWELKNRIASSHGHLSNDTAASFLAELLHNDLCHVVLAHLSENSNTPTRALDTHLSILSTSPWFSLECGSVRAPSRVYQVGENVPNSRLALAS